MQSQLISLISPSFLGSKTELCEMNVGLSTVLLHSLILDSPIVNSESKAMKGFKDSYDVGWIILGFLVKAPKTKA